MIKRVLGRTGFEVTALGVGCYQCTGQFGVSPEQADRLMDFAMKSEINYFDTAMFYGFGESEELVARGLLNNPDKKAIVCDKIGHLDMSVSKIYGDEAYVNPMEIKRALKHSLWVLRRESFDLLMIHEAEWPAWYIDYDNGDSVIISVLEELKKEGLIKAIGIGSWDIHTTAKLVNTGRIDCVLCAGGINLLEKPIFDELIPASKICNAGVTVGACFGQNNPLLVSKDFSKLPDLLGSDDKRLVTMARKLKRLYEIADDLGIDMIEMAIRYILSFDDIHCHAPGARSDTHIRNNIEAANKGPLDKTLVEEINAIQKMGSSLSSLELAGQIESDIKI